MNDTTTLCIGPTRKDCYGNPELKVRIFGFIGGQYVDLPYRTQQEAYRVAKAHGWELGRVEDLPPCQH